jgi:hypothetical protein
MGQIEPLDPRTLRLDPATFQFKESDARGVTGSLRGVERWEPTSPPLVVFEAADGTRYVADGHQRFNKYLELMQRGKPMPPLYGLVLRETEGWTIPRAVRLASLRNIQEGSAQPLDIARLIWNGGELTPTELATVPKSAMVGERLRRGEALGRITHPVARQMLINKQVDPDYASFVGQYIADPDQQLAVLQKLAKADIDNLRQAETFVQSMAEGEFEQQSLFDMFGSQDVAIPLAETKAKLADAARRALHEQRAAFAGAVRHADRLAQAGNTLLADVNVANLDQAKRLLAYFDKVALAKGTHTNAALTEGAKQQLRGLWTRDYIIRQVLAAVQRDLEGAPVPAAPSAGAPAAPPPVPAPRPAAPAGRVGPEDRGRPEVLSGVDRPGGAVVPAPEPERAAPGLRAGGGAPEGRAGAVTPPPPSDQGLLPMREAPLGQYLAPPTKDYVFIKLERGTAEAYPELRKQLRAAGYRYRANHEAWFKNRGAMTPEEAEAEAQALLSGETTLQPARPAAPREEAPAAPPEPPPPPPRVEVNEFGEGQPVLLEVPETPPPGLKEKEDLLFHLYVTAKKRTGLAQRQAIESVAPLAEELSQYPRFLADDTLRHLTYQRLSQEAKERVLQEMERRGLVKRQPAPTQPTLEAAAPEPEPAAPPPPPPAPAPKPARPAPPAAERPAGSIPANVRSFLRRQLGYSDEDIAAMTPEEAQRIGRERIRKPGTAEPEPKAKAKPAAPPPKPAEAAPPPPPPPTRRAPAAAAEPPAQPPASLEELLLGYLREAAPQKMARIRERMTEARFAQRAKRVPISRTYRGNEEFEPILPEREFGPPPPKTATEIGRLERAGVSPDAAEARLMAEAEAQAQERAARPRPEPPTEQERIARGEPIPKTRVSQKLQGEEGGLTRMNVRRAHEMREALEEGRLDDYAEMLLSQVERENEAAFRMGTKRGEPGRVWGEDMLRLRYDQQTGEYLGSGLGALEQLLRTNPGLFWRVGGGTLVGLALGDAQDLDGPELFLAALAGAGLGAIGSPRNIKTLARMLRERAPSIARLSESLRRETLREWKRYETAIRRPRDTSKDLGLVQQLWRSPSYVDPDTFRRAWQLMQRADQAMAGVKDPKLRLYLHRYYRRQAASELRATAKVAERLGFTREARYWRRHAAIVAGEPPLLAQWVSRLTGGEVTPKRVEQVMRELERHMYRLTLGLAIDSGLINRTQVLLALPRVGHRALAKGLLKGRTAAGQQEAAAAGLQFSDLADLPMREPSAGRDLIDAIDRAMFSPMRLTDEANRRDVYLAGLEYAKRKGLSKDDATAFAFDLAMQTQGVPGDLGYNPYLHELTPFRGLAKYPVLLAEMIADTLTHPDRRVMLRMLGLLTGAYGLTNLLKLDIMQWLTPRFAVVGPMWDATKKVLNEEFQHLTQYLPGGTPVDHALADELVDLVVPRYAKKVYQAVKRSLPREMGGYGYGTGPRPVYDTKGRLREERTGLEELLNLFGIQTTRQSESRRAVDEAYRFEREQRAERAVTRQRAYGKLRDAIERGDAQAIAEAEADLTPQQLREFYRTAPLPPVERIRRRLPRAAREAYGERVSQ